MTKKRRTIHGSDHENVFDVEAVTRDVQEAFAPYRALAGSVVDELIAERRNEARIETVRSGARDL